MYVRFPDNDLLDEHIRRIAEKAFNITLKYESYFNYRGFCGEKISEFSIDNRCFVIAKDSNHHYSVVLAY